MNFDIALFLIQDGVTTGAIYALLALALLPASSDRPLKKPTRVVVGGKSLPPTHRN